MRDGVQGSHVKKSHESTGEEEGKIEEDKRRRKKRRVGEQVDSREGRMRSLSSSGDREVRMKSKHKGWKNGEEAT